MGHITFLYKLVKFLSECSGQYDIIECSIYDRTHRKVSFFCYKDSRIYEVHIENAPLDKHQAYIKKKREDNILDVVDADTASFNELLIGI